MILELVEVGDPVLRQQSRPVTRDEILAPEFGALVQSMRETMHAAPGVGLAAPQIGESLQLAVIEDRADYLAEIPEERLAELRRAPVPFHVLVNPTMSAVGDESAEFYEGCLSVPGYQAKVRRALSVNVSALDERGEPVSFVAEGWHARIVQHEIDHLNGALYIDWMDPHTFTTNDNRALGT